MIGPVRIVRGVGIAAACLALVVGGVLGADAIGRGNGRASPGLVQSLQLPGRVGPATGAGATVGARSLASPDAGRKPTGPTGTLEPKELAEATHSPKPSEGAEPGDDNGVDADDADDADDLNDDHGAGVEASDDKGGLRPSESPEPGKTPRPGQSPRPSSSAGSNSGSNSGSGSGGGSNGGSGHR